MSEEKRLADLMQRVELLEATAQLRRGWLDGMDERLAKIEARLSFLEDGLGNLSVTLTAAIAEGESWKKALELELDDYKTKVEQWMINRKQEIEAVDLKCQQIERDLTRLSTRLQDSHERWEGQKVRIDRQVGTMQDLLARFEAWKTVGNEMGETVNNHQGVLEAHQELHKVHQEALTALADRQDIQSEMLKALTALGKDVGGFMREVQQILGRPDLPGDAEVPSDVKT